jgi:uncharacterized protein with PIN domain
LTGEPERGRIDATLATSSANLMSAGAYLECAIVLALRQGAPPGRPRPGGCSGYALATQPGVPLLYVGDHFERTDVEAA